MSYFDSSRSCARVQPAQPLPIMAIVGLFLTFSAAAAKSLLNWSVWERGILAVVLKRRLCVEVCSWRPLDGLEGRKCDATVARRVKAVVC